MKFNTGAGIGYYLEPDSPGSWMSLDGLEWVPLHSTIHMAVEPILAEVDSNTVFLERQTSKSLAEQDVQAPLRTELLLPSPNPFNPQTTIRFTLKRACDIRLSVYDIRGREVASLASGLFSAGLHEVVWGGRDGQGKGSASGVYLARLNADGKKFTQRMLLVK